jgi:hypothetical protein
MGSMKNQRMFSGIVLLGVGLFFLSQQLSILTKYTTWPTLLIIAGAAFLFQAYGERNYEVILPGVILTGLGFHFHLVNILSIWPDITGAFILFIALGFILRSRKVGNSLMPGLFFLTLAAIMFFYNQIFSLLGLSVSHIGIIAKFWPLILILIGCYFLFFRKK